MAERKLIGIGVAAFAGVLAAGAALMALNWGLHRTDPDQHAADQRAIAAERTAFLTLVEKPVKIAKEDWKLPFACKRQTLEDLRLMEDDDGSAARVGLTPMQTSHFDTTTRTGVIRLQARTLGAVPHPKDLLDDEAWMHDCAWAFPCHAHDIRIEEEGTGALLGIYDEKRLKSLQPRGSEAAERACP